MEEIAPTFCCESTIPCISFYPPEELSILGFGFSLAIALQETTVNVSLTPRGGRLEDEINLAQICKTTVNVSYLEGV